MQEFYEPSEDSYLISETLKREIPKILKYGPKLKFLEIGCGSGINLQAALESGIKKENILGTDINKKAVENCKKLGFNCFESDLFRNIDGRFDVIIFNPPYLPLDKREPKNSRRKTTGGKKGNEITIKFLKEAKKHLHNEGRIFLVTSSLSKFVDFEKLGYEAKRINSKKLFFEELVVWRVWLGRGGNI